MIAVKLIDLHWLNLLYSLLAQLAGAAEYTDCISAEE